MCFSLTLRELISVCHWLTTGLWSSPTCEWGQLLQVSSQWLINMPVIMKRSEEIDFFCDAIALIILTVEMATMGTIQWLLMTYMILCTQGD